MICTRASVSAASEAGWRVRRAKDPAAAPLRAWAERMTARRGTTVAAGTRARRVAGMRYALWRDGTTYRAPVQRDATAAYGRPHRLRGA